MDKEKQIEEMARSISKDCEENCDWCDLNGGCTNLHWAREFYNAGYRKQEYGRWLFVCEHANRLDYECENCRNHIQTINEPDYILVYKRCPNCGAIMEAYKKRI